MKKTKANSVASRKKRKEGMERREWTAGGGRG